MTNARFRADVALVYTDFGAVLLDQRAGQYWQLNATGAIVARVLQAGSDTEAAVDALSTQLDVERAIARADVDTLLANLHTAGLIDR